ncbi:NTE family protein [Salinimicrobium sediminis]|uniref:NTE family protein n=1 Tax=Salinimicrobium sediminis TaxID=1343891 RepID=A0A285X1D8_9FLAO|nr:patatin-like phospholipase family protein [Salinimicrobium sediminis]SOC79157.1 NTE family protein [Salinimicrobium sediminis]
MLKKTFLILLLLITLPGLSQEEDPKVGLVLSGGGAKGLAHIGVLKVLEEAGVRIDYIGGTSMGAIIGSLYSAGYSAHQLDSIFQRTNFNILIQDELPRAAKTFYEKRDSERYAITLPFDNFDVSFPSALSRGQNVYNLMSKLTLHLKDQQDFSEMPIPFFAVATDVETGEEVILDSGHLPQAISASSAIPSLFNPVLIDGRLLTDGGVVNNYPVEELRKRGAELIIGVDVQDTLMAREELRSVFEILTQVSNFRTIADMTEKIEKTDVFIKPDITDFSVMSFEKGAEIIQSGEQAARSHMEVLKEIAAKQSKSSRQVRLEPGVDSLYITNLRIEGNNSYPRAYVLGKLKLQFPATVTYKDLSLGINNLSATKNFNRINYRLVPLNEGYVLALQLEENPNKTLLRLGLHYDNVYQSAALVNLTHKRLLFANDVTSLDVALGDNFRYNFNYYIDKGFYWSFGIRSRFNSFSQGVAFDFARENAGIDIGGINQLEIDYEDFTNQLYVETLFKQVFSFGIGLEHKYLDITSETIGTPTPEQPATGVFDKSSYYGSFGNLTLDNRDYKYFPTKGVYFNGDFHWYLLSSDFNGVFEPFSVAKGELGYNFSPVQKLTMKISSEAGFRIGSRQNNIFDFFLGGYGNDFINNFTSFYGYPYISLSGDSFIKGLVELDYRFLRKNHLVLSANFANVENDLYSTGDWFTWPDYSGYAIGYGLETFLGPVEIKYSISPELKESQWYFSLGFWF